jgi:hypothetical protein
MAVPMTISAAVADFSSQRKLFLQKEKTSVVNTVDHQRKNLSVVLLTSVNNLTLVSWTLVNNLSVVTLTLAITFFSGVVDTDQKQPKSLKFIARLPENCSPGVNDTTDE